MEKVKANDRDVLMGRGKHISEWAGNVYFRQIVNTYRNEYIQSIRDMKVKIANRVINIIHKNGGRFLQEVEGCSGEYFVISHFRATEKCCQALREKGLFNPLKGNPFVKVPAVKVPPAKASKTAAKKAKKLPLKGKKRKNARRNPIQALSEDPGKDQDKEGERKHNRSRHTKSLLSQSSDANDEVTKNREFTKESNEETKTEHKEVTKNELHISQSDDITFLMESPMDRLKNLSDDEILQRLEHFIREHRHAAVPPGWAGDPDLADWCTIKRQHFRMATKGYGNFGPQETKLLNHLSSLNFVWDYDEWHWNRQFRKYNSPDKKTNRTVNADKQKLDRLSAVWINDQKQQHLSKSQPISKNRLKILKDAGITFP